MDIKKRIKTFFMEQLEELGRNGDIDLKDDTLLIESGIIDSLLILNLIAFLEENYGIFLSPEQMNRKNFATLQKIYELVAQKASVT